VDTRTIDHAALRGGGFLAFPEGKGRHPGVVVIHEAHGLNQNIKDITIRFAENGYVGLAVDLFAGRNRAICMARFMTGMLRGSIERFGIDDLKAALSYMTTLEGVDPNRVGAVGFCMGGSFAIAWACSDDRLRAIAPYYASNPRPLEAVRRICPVVGSYPQKDFTAAAGRGLDAELTRRDIPHDIKVYPGARHSFFRAGGGAYDRAAADDSWRRVMSFFGTHLGTRAQAASKKT